MFSLISNSNETDNNSEKDDQTVILEAFQGDTALIQAVNELNNLKQFSTEPSSI